jgi:hypothetical protein
MNEQRGGRRIRTGRDQNVSAPPDEGRVREERHDVLQTHLPKFYTYVLHGADPDYRRSAVKAIRRKGNAFHAIGEAIKKLRASQGEPLRSLVQLATDNEGLVGYRDLQEGVEVEMESTTVDVFNERLMDISLGNRRPAYDREKVFVTVELDPKIDNVGRFVASQRRRFLKQGIPAEQLDQRVRVERSKEVDTEALGKDLKAGAITLIPGAWIKERHWEVDSRSIPKSEEADEDARDSAESLPKPDGIILADGGEKI